MSVQRLIVSKAEIGQRLGIGYERTKTLLERLKIEPIVGGNRPLYAWGEIEQALGGKSAEPDQIAALQPPPAQPKIKRVQVHANFMLTENEAEHLERACATAGESKCALVKNLVLDYLTRAKELGTNGLAQHM